jgi:hypothetical protein
MIKAQLGIKGYVEWYLIDKKSGVILRHGKHKNLLVNGMKNALQTLTMNTLPIWGGHRTQLVVGDNAAAPAVGQTALSNQIGSSSSSGSYAFQGPQTGTKDTTNNRLVYSSMIRRVYTFPSTQNVREIGFKDSGGNLTVRFLPLDGSSNPTTITGNAGQELLVEHTLEVSLPWPSSLATTSFKIGTTGGNDGAGTFAVEYTFYANTGSNIQQVLLQLLGPDASNLSLATVAMGTINRDPTFSGGNFATYNLRLAAQTYVADSGQRVRQGVLGTGESNVALYGAILATTNIAYGLAIKFTNPTSYTKSNTNQITIPYRSEVILNASA